MAYASLSDLRTAAGGQAALEEISQTESAPVLALAQAAADGEIDSRARRLWGDALPFSPVPDVIRAMSAEESVRRLRSWARVPQPLEDAEKRRQYEDLLDRLERGMLIPPPSSYPLAGAAAPAPVMGTRTMTTEEVADGRNDRDSMKGFW